MKDPKKPEVASSTGATIQLVSKMVQARKREISANCRPCTEDPLVGDECAPDYTCRPDCEASKKEKGVPEADDCADYGCCPNKEEQECDPNV